MFLVFHLTKSGHGHAVRRLVLARHGHHGRRRAERDGGYALIQAANVGSFPLNKAAATAVESSVAKSTKTVAAALKAKKAGQLGKSVSGIYDMGPTTSLTSTAYKGLIFIGYDGTYDPAAVIKIVRSHLESTRIVAPGPHGGEMTCGYNTSTGSRGQRVRVGHQDHPRLRGVHQGPCAGQAGGSVLALKVRQAGGQGQPTGKAIHRRP